MIFTKMGVYGKGIWVYRNSNSYGYNLLFPTKERGGL